MTKHFLANDYSNGIVTGFYDDADEPYIVGSLPISDTKWQEAINAQAQGDVLKVLNNLVVPQAPTLTVIDIAFQKHAEISQAYNAEIYNGLISDVLGSEHLYPINEKSKLNLIGAVIGGVDQTFGCFDSSGVFDHRVHTISQLTELLQHGTNKIQGLEVGADNLRKQVNTAVENNDFSAINELSVDLTGS